MQINIYNKMKLKPKKYLIEVSEKKNLLNKTYLILVVCLLVLIEIKPAFSQDNQDNDNGTSTPTSTTTALVVQPGIGLRYMINKKWRLYQDFRTYLNQDNPAKNFEELSFGLRYYMGKVNNFYFSTTAGYLFSIDNNYKIKAYRPKIYFNTTYHLNNIRFEFRNRLEYSIVTGNNSGASLRYRPRFRIGSTFKLKEFRLSPYVYNEFFFGQNGFSQNRTKLALSVRYHNFRFTAGNLVKIKPGNGWTENRVSFDFSYTIPTIKKKEKKDTIL